MKSVFSGQKPSTIYILLVGERESVRELSAKFKPEPDIKVVGIADCGCQALQQVIALQPNRLDMVLIDRSMPIADSTEAINHIISRHVPNIRTVEISRSNKVCHIANWLKLRDKVHVFETQIGASVNNLPQIIRLVDSEYRLIKIASDLIWQHQKRELNESEIAILNGACQGEIYKKTAEDRNYSFSHLENTGHKLWKDLSKALNKDINKTNVRLALEQEQQRSSQSNLSNSQIQLRNSFVNFLWFTRNTYLKSVGSEKIILENWQAVCQPKFDLDTKLNAVIVIQVIDSFVYLCTGTHLTPREVEVIYGVWNDKIYNDIAKDIKRSCCKDRELCGTICQCRYNTDYIRKDVAGKLWSKLSEVFIFIDFIFIEKKTSKKRINRYNFKQTLEQLHEKMKLSFT